VRRKLLIMMVISSFLCAVSTFAATGKVLTVGADGGQYEKIQEAIDAAGSGDTVKILPGIYIENITINKSLTIAGTSKEEVVIRAASIDKPAVFFRGVADFSLENLCVETGGAAVNISRSSGRIIDLRVAGGRFGISFSGSAMTLIIMDSYITTLAGAESDGPVGTDLVGIYAYGEASLEIEKTTFERTGTGVSLSNGMNFLIKNSTFKRNTIGVALNGTASGSLIENRVFENIENGVLLNITSSVVLIDNIFYSNSGHGLDLYLIECTECGCGGTEFNGTVTGSGNLFDSEEEICPIEYWEDGFFFIDRDLAVDRQ